MLQLVLLNLADADVFELDPHRFASVELQREDTLSQGFGVIVGEVQNEPAVHVVLDVIAVGDDDDVVPLIKFKKLGVLFGSNQVACDFLLPVVAGDCFFTDETRASTSARQAAFVVDESADVWQFVFVSNFVLIATDAPRCLVGIAFGAVLDARVVGGVASE